MIDQKELRIGNYVCKTDNPQSFLEHNFSPYIQVETISKTGVNAVTVYDEDMDSEGIDYTPYVDELTFEQLHPILLTSELLEKCGFKDGRLTINISAVRPLYLQSANNGTVVFYWGEGNSQPSPYSIHYEYLHQLQNLYFALTGEEMEIKL